MKKSLIILLLLLCSCASRKPVGLYTTGTILMTENDRVFVLFEDAFDRPGNFLGDWFYFPGIGLINREDYSVEVKLIKRKP